MRCRSKIAFLVLFIVVFCQYAFSSPVDELSYELLRDNPNIIESLEDTLFQYYESAQIAESDYKRAKYGNRFVIKGIIQSAKTKEIIVRGIAISEDGNKLKRGAINQESLIQIKKPGVDGKEGEIFKGADYRYIETRRERNSYGIVIPIHVYGPPVAIPLDLVQRHNSQMSYWDNHAARYLDAIEIKIRGLLSNNKRPEAKKLYFTTFKKNIYSRKAISDWEFRVKDILKLNDDEKEYMLVGEELAKYLIKLSSEQLNNIEKDSLVNRHNLAIENLAKAKSYNIENPDLSLDFQNQINRAVVWLLRESEIKYYCDHQLFEAYALFLQAFDLKTDDQKNLENIEKLKLVFIPEVLAVAKDGFKQGEKKEKIQEIIDLVLRVDPENKKAKLYTKKLERY